MRPATQMVCGVLLAAALGAAGSARPAADRQPEQTQAATHWAFRPIGAPPLPAVKDRSWPQTSIDTFIRAKLEENGLTPAAPADRRTLIRRATFDLLGLPPTPEEVEAFASDSSPDTYRRLVERLLASPHYGERWGRHWLDVARYADTKGYVFFEEKEFPWAWTYRDYVIHAFNEDLPYDRFLLEQLAADLLAKDASTLPTPASKRGDNGRALPALGFLTLGGRFMNNLHDILDDRIDVVTRGLMGLTVTCARCHDHKFDPISSKDYYGLYGVFASSAEPTVPPLYFEPPRTPEYLAFEKELAAREGKLRAFIEEKHFAVTRDARTRVAEYLQAAHALRDRPRSDDFMLISDPGDINPTMTLRWKALFDRTRRRHDPVWAPWHALMRIEEKDLPAKATSALAEFIRTGGEKAVNPLVLQALLDRPLKTHADVARCYADLLKRIDAEWQCELTTGGLATTLGFHHSPLITHLPTNPHRRQLLDVFYGAHAPANWPLHTIDDLLLFPDRASQGKLQELRNAVQEWRVKGTGAPPRATTLEDAPVPYQPRVFLRGNPNNLGEAVPRQFLSVLNGLGGRPFQHGSGRLELARAIVDPQNPLTARVMVNRLWLHHFGQGLVRTPGDFGLRSEPPSHPELLDHLANEFIRSGWSIKALHRSIMMSATYQQGSGVRNQESGIRKLADPENRLLGRMTRRRLDFEAMRDALLAVSGRLDETVGGPSMRDLLGPNANRRTLYAHFDRLNVPGLYRTFDFPSPDATSPQRDQTTVAPQALFFMNSPFLLDCARRVLARPELANEQDVDRRVERLYQVIYQRSPTAEEARLARDFLAGGGAPAWQRYVQALLLGNEFVFVD